MSKPDIIAEQPLPMFTVLEELKAIQKKDKELNFRSNRTLEYLQQFVTLDARKAQELELKIRGLKITRLMDQRIYKIIDILPKTVEELRAVLLGYPVTIKAEDMKKIVAAVIEFAK